ERLVGAAAAAAEIRGGEARHCASRTAHDLEIAAHAQRTIGLRVDREHPIAHREHLGLAGRRLTAGREADLVMRAVAVGLVLRGAAAAQRGAKARWGAIDL